MHKQICSFPAAKAAGSRQQLERIFSTLLIFQTSLLQYSSQMIEKHTAAVVGRVFVYK